MTDEYLSLLEKLYSFNIFLQALFDALRGLAVAIYARDFDLIYFK
jgi:hypothetical protein